MRSLCANLDSRPLLSSLRRVLSYPTCFSIFSLLLLLLRYLVYASVSRCTREQLFQPFRKMRRGQGQGQVCQRIIVLSISRSPRPMCFSAQAFPLTANGCKLRRELYFFQFLYSGGKIFVFRRYVIKFCSGELLNDYE